MIDSINQRIADLVVEYFEGNNSKFAEFIGTSEASIRNYRHKKTVPSIEIVVAICEKLALRYEWLLTGVGERRGTTSPTEENTPIHIMLNRIEALNREVGELREKKRRRSKYSEMDVSDNKERKAAEPGESYTKEEDTKND